MPLSTNSAFYHDITEAIGLFTSLTHAERVALVWSEPDEPWTFFALASPSGDVAIHKESPLEPEPFLTDQLCSQAFFCTVLPKTGVEIVRKVKNGLILEGNPFSGKVGRLIPAKNAMAFPVTTETFEGYFVALDTPGFDEETFGNGIAVAKSISYLLDRAWSAGKMGENAISNERVRLARELHDGVIQSLTAADLLLEAAKSSAADPVPILSKVQKLLLEEQKSLRAIAESFRPDFSRKPSIDCDVKAMIRETCDRVRRYWGIDIEMSVATPLPRVHESLAHEACSIVHEALVNAVKHGKATNANVELSSSSAGNGTLALSIEDDGVGFSFHGRFTLADMIEQKIGPMALRERVIAIGGSLVIESTPDGSKIAVALPIGGDPGCPKQ